MNFKTYHDGCHKCEDKINKKFLLLVHVKNCFSPTQKNNISIELYICNEKRKSYTTYPQ